MSDKVIDKFTSLVERAFSADVEKLANHDFKKFQSVFKNEYDAAIKIVISVKDAKILTDLMKAYLTLYERYASKPNNIHYYRSDQLFEILVEQSGKLTDESLFETWDAYFEPSAPIVSFRNRYNDLSATSKSHVDRFRKDEREKRRQRLSILDLLRLEYARQNTRPPKSNDELYDFDPRPAIGQGVEAEVARVMKTWNVKGGEFTKDNAASLDKAIDAFAAYLKQHGKDDVLALFQNVRQLRVMMNDKRLQQTDPRTGRTTTARISVGPQEKVVLYALYAVACIQLLAAAQVGKLYTRNRLGFTSEETEFFFKPVARDNFLYQSNILKVLTAPFAGPGIAIGQLKAFLNAYVLTANQLRGCDLVPLNQTMEIQDKWLLAKNLSDLIGLAARSNDAARLNDIFADAKHARAIASLTELGSTRLDTKNPWVLGQRTLTAGASLGSHSKYGDIVVVYIDPKDTNQIFVEFSTLKPQIFLVHKNYVDDKVYREAIMEIYRSTAGIVELTEIIFAAMGFIPVLIEVGFAGLIYELALTYVSGQVEDIASEVNPTFGKILGVLIQTFARRPNFKPRLRTDMLERADNTLLNDALQERATDKLFLDRDVNASNRATGANFGGKPSLPGPPEDFPFASGNRPPQPESPNRVYRIMSNDEAAKALNGQRLPPPIRGAEGERFVSLDSDYSMLFREKELADIEEKFGAQVEAVGKSLKNIDDRLSQLKAAEAPKVDAISKINARRETLLNSQRERGLANRAEAEKVIGAWHEAEGQQVVVEIELEPGALDEMLSRSVDVQEWGKYSTSGKDVFLWKLERGYGRNIGIPKWQLEGFNSRIKSIRMHSYKQPLGKIKPGLGNN